jgi:putative transposase
MIVDNYGTNKHPRVKRWLAQRPRFQVHFTPTYASWLTQVEIWFNRITQQAIRRGTFRSVNELVEKIDQPSSLGECAALSEYILDQL